MPPVSLLPFLLLLAGAAATAPAEPPAPAPPAKNETIYDLLPLFGLPAGVFPANVTAFSLAGNGSLAVDLKGPCYVHFEYLTYFEPRVTSTGSASSASRSTSPRPRASSTSTSAGSPASSRPPTSSPSTPARPARGGGAASPPRSPPPPLGSRTSLPNFSGCRRSNFVAASHELTAFPVLMELEHYTLIC